MGSEADVIAKIDALERDYIDECVDWQMTDSPAAHTEHGGHGYHLGPSWQQVYGDAPHLPPVPQDETIPNWAQLYGVPDHMLPRAPAWQVTCHNPRPRPPVPPALWVIDSADMVLHHHSATVQTSVYRLGLRFYHHPMRIDVHFRIDDERVDMLLPAGCVALYTIGNVGGTGWNVRLEKTAANPPIKAVLYGDGRPEHHVPARLAAPGE